MKNLLLNAALIATSVAAFTTAHAQSAPQQAIVQNRTLLSINLIFKQDPGGCGTVTIDGQQANTVVPVPASTINSAGQIASYGTSKLEYVAANCNGVEHVTGAIQFPNFVDTDDNTKTLGWGLAGTQPGNIYLDGYPFTTQVEEGTDEAPRQETYGVFNNAVMSVTGSVGAGNIMICYKNDNYDPNTGITIKANCDYQ